MRIALISDLHANAAALAALSDVLESADRVVCLGDIVGYYCQVNETIALLRGYNPLCVLGNHDAYLLRGNESGLPESVRFGLQYAERVITPENRAWLAGLPHMWGGQMGELSCLFFHGSPWQPIEHYLYMDSPLLSGLDHFNFDLIAFGQTHRALIRMDKRPLLINPGSVGQSRDAMSYGRACAVICETASKGVEVIERGYDMQAVVDEALSQGAGDWVRKFVPSGTRARGR
ncbi:MAG TPA: metallophosphoesterase family protein [Candidatus Obscuribacterales bacterium]